MQQRRLGRSGLVVSRLALGTMGWGAGSDDDDARSQLRAFRDAGGTLIDSADHYAAGTAQTTLGRLLASTDRAELVLAAGAAAAGRRPMLAALDATLLRLGTDHVDLWQVDSWDRDTPLEETLAACDAAVTSGRARYAGVANYTGWQTAQAATWQRAVPGRVPLVSAKAEYSLLQRGVEREAVGAADAAGMGLLAFAPLGRGVLTGKYRGGTPADSRGASPTWSRYVGAYLTYEAGRVVDAVVTAADGLGVTPLAVALAWVRDRPGVAAPIVGTRTAAQLVTVLATERVELPVEIRTALDDVSAPRFGYPEHHVPRSLA
jgi:aryl-alcohol dehydrogenase-like predicted oxidoreductase